MTATTLATVARRALVRSESFDGELGFGDPRPLGAFRAGVVTAMAEQGTVIEPGGVLYAINAEPTVLLTGEMPAWRPLAVGTAAGPDIRQLNQALVALGYGAGLSADDTFTAATVNAVKAWETKLGRPNPDGRVELGDVVFQPGPLRVASVETDLGDRMQTGAPVLTTTDTTRIVTLGLDPDNKDVVRQSDQVSIELPDSKTITGTVDKVAAEATPDPAQPDAQPTLPVTISLSDQSKVQAFDTATVTIKVTKEQRNDVLAVPVTALLATAEGGYAVEVPDRSDPGEYRRVTVEPGLYADGWVEVRSDSLDEGTKVAVPR